MSFMSAVLHREMLTHRAALDAIFCTSNIFRFRITSSAKRYQFQFLFLFLFQFYEHV